MPRLAMPRAWRRFVGGTSTGKCVGGLAWDGEVAHVHHRVLEDRGWICFRSKNAHRLLAHEVAHLAAGPSGDRHGPSFRDAGARLA